MRSARGVSQAGAVMDLPGLPAEAVDVFRRFAYRRFYGRPRALLNLATMIDPRMVLHAGANLRAYSVGCRAYARNLGRSRRRRRASSKRPHPLCRQRGKAQPAKAGRGLSGPLHRGVSRFRRSFPKGYDLHRRMHVRPGQDPDPNRTRAQGGVLPHPAAQKNAPAAWTP